MSFMGTYGFSMHVFMVDSHYKITCRINYSNYSEKYVTQDWLYKNN